MPGATKKGGKKSGNANARVAKRIEAMSWNKDYSQVAVGVEKDIIIYSAPEANKKAWKKVAELENAHGLDISGLDWSPVTNSIVSCSHDRNAYVWSLDESGAWKPTLVILHVSRAALCCSWSPNGKKFAIGSGCKTVSVCQFDESQNWWSPKIINKKRGSSIQHKSSIVSLAWHPSSQFLATACADKKCRVYCAAVGNDGDVDAGAMGKFLEDESPDFGDPLFEFHSQGWVHDVSFSPSGEQLVFVSHDSTVTVVNFGEDGEEPAQRILPFRSLPFTTCLWHGEDQIIVGGYDFYPLRIDRSGEDWEFGKPVDKMEAKTSKKGNSAMAKFQNRDNLGQDKKVESLLTKHQSAIRCMRLNGHSLYTAGSDGRLQFWKL